MSSPTAPSGHPDRATALVRVPRGLLVALAESGADLPADARAAGIDERQLEQREVELDRRSFDRLLDVVFDPSRGATVGLRMGARVRLELFGVLGMVVLSAPTYRAALGRCARYKRLLSSLRVRLNEGLHQAHIEVASLESPESPHYAARVEAELGFLATVGRRLASPSVLFDRATLRRPYPTRAEAAEFEEVLGCPVRFGAARDALVLPRSSLGHLLISADPEAFPLLSAAADRRLSTSGPELVARVRRTVERLLPEGTPTVREVAAQLGVSPRTLQRRLRAEGRSVTSVLDEARRELAYRYLRDSPFGVVEISYLLGFAHPNSFHRAFLRWSGTTPAAYRAQRS